jgi:hypothetical protein
MDPFKKKELTPNPNSPPSYHITASVLSKSPKQTFLKKGIPPKPKRAGTVHISATAPVNREEH